MTKDDMIREVEKHLKMWRKEQDRVWNTERDAASIAFSHGDGEPVQSSAISDKTARAAFMLDSIRDVRVWVDCITDAMQWLSQERPDLQRLLYGHYGMEHQRGYKRKTAKSFTKSYRIVYGISYSEYNQRRLDALDEVSHFATEYGLFRRCKQFNSELNDKKQC